MDVTAGTRDIVRRTDLSAVAAAAAAADASMAQWRAEHLAVPGTGRIHIDLLPSEDDVTHQLARRVAQDPTDARLHVARVNHHVLILDSDGAYAALVDLYLAFGPSAAGLRTRLLDGARQLIGPERTAALEVHRATGLAVKDPMPVCTGSMLSAGVTGETDIVRHRPVDQVAEVPA